MIEYFVAADGDDAHSGSKEQPFRTLSHARDVLRIRESKRTQAATVWIRGGTHRLAAPLEFEAQDSGDSAARITFAAYPGERPTLCGSRRLACNWQPYRDGIYMCDLGAAGMGTNAFSQLFVNGRREIRARYPNYDPSDPGQYSGQILAAGKIADHVVDPAPGPDDDMTFSSAPPRGITFDPSNFTDKRWARPQEAVIHIYQAHYWGNLQWQIKEIDWGERRIWFGEGGQQMGAKWSHTPCEVNERSYYYIENLLEELDAPREWYLDAEIGRLYYMPPADVDLNAAEIEVPAIQQLVRAVGSRKEPASHITQRGLRFTQSTSTFMEAYTIPSLSDWAIHRGGALFFQGTKECVVEECDVDGVGGNAIFMSGYNRNNRVRGCRFAQIGDSAICFVGALENTVGSQREFCYECEASNNLIHDCGVFGKQVAGVYISRAKRIKVSHNRIYRMPRAGICIGDGTWGGHIIEHNHISDTCRETGDHGPFNAWGRDKYWCLVQSHTDYIDHHSHFAGHVLVDAMEPVVIRGNLFREKSGWGLDLDDGASNYEIYNNLCVGVSMKLREGAYRTIYNNIWVDGANSPCFHVGNENNHDRYFRNITVMSTASMVPEADLNFEMGQGYGEIYTLIAPPARGPWLEEIDHNCFYSDLGEFVARVQLRGTSSDWQYSQSEGAKYSLEDWRELGFDQHSIFADPLFVDPENGDYRVRPESPALKLGFENFAMDEFGLTADFPQRLLEQGAA